MVRVTQFTRCSAPAPLHSQGPALLGKSYASSLLLGGGPDSEQHQGTRLPPERVPLPSPVSLNFFTVCPPLCQLVQPQALLMHILACLGREVAQTELGGS